MKLTRMPALDSGIALAFLASDHVRREEANVAAVAAREGGRGESTPRLQITVGVREREPE